jgi:hypothetical protein
MPQGSSKLVAAFVCALLLFCGAPSLQAQQTAAVRPQDSAPKANPADVSSIDAILAALYDVISGPAGGARDWNRFHSLFLPGARMMPTRARPDGGADVLIWSTSDWIERATPMFVRLGFHEKQTAVRVEQFGNIAHAFSTYESRYAASDPQPFTRGINSIQLLRDAGRWWVVSIMWDAERADNPLPAKYQTSP